MRSLIILMLLVSGTAHAVCSNNTLYSATTAPVIEVGYSTVPGGNFLIVTSTEENMLKIGASVVRNTVDLAMANNCVEMALRARGDTTNLLFSFGYYGAATDAVLARGNGCAVMLNSSHSIHDIKCKLGSK